MCLICLPKKILTLKVCDLRLFVGNQNPSFHLKARRKQQNYHAPIPLQNPKKMMQRFDN